MIHMVSTEAKHSNRKIYRMMAEVGGIGTQIGSSIRLMFPVYRGPLTSYSWQAFLRNS